MSDWFYAANNEQKGPINESELKANFASNKLPVDTLVWKDGMDNWTPANQIAAFTFRQPPTPAATQPPQPAAKAAAPISVASPSTTNPDSTKPVGVADLIGKPESLEVTTDDVEKNKVFGILAYLGPLCLLPLFAAKDSPFAKYHANQGLTLFLLEIVLSIGVYALDLFIYSIMAGATFISTSLSVAEYLVSLGLMIFGIINAAGGKCVPLPVIGGIKLLK